MNGIKRISQKEQALIALVGAPSLRAASIASGVPERTLRTWLAEKEFSSRYEAMRREAIAVAWANLQTRIGEASEVVMKIMNNPKAPPQTRLNAARTVLEYGFKSIEQLDILKRLEALEAAEKSRKTPR